MKKPILITLALAFSGSAFASDLTDYIAAVSIGSNWKENNNSELCKNFTRMYSSPDTEIKCYTSSSPLYITANPITLYPSLYKGYTGTDKNGLILGKYSFNSEKSFKLEIGNFYTYNVYTNPAGKDVLSIDIILDQATRYSTDIVLKQRKY